MTAQPAHSLPDEPLISIRPGKTPISLVSLWSYRELLYFLTWRDIRVRYRQTLLGAMWAVTQPLFTMIIFTLFFSKLAKIPSDGVPYPLFAYAGLLPWIFFSNAVNHSSNSLVGNAQLITKIYFPRLIIPTAAVAAGLVDFMVAFALLAVLMVYYGVAPAWSLLLLPFLVITTAALALAVGMWMSALNVKYRDIRFILPFALQLLMFITPIIYPSTMVPSPWRQLLSINPLAGLIEAYRASLYGRPFNWQTLIQAAAVTFLFLAVSSFYFHKTERTFADLV
ncbi:MAG: ABC transporter permease [Blastocatellia bacterium]|nr:ABC transporter permease [Blastocatellia bacterium]